MNITQEKIDDLNAIVNVELKQEDYQTKLQSALKTFSKQLQLKGFRKGRVPLGMVKKMHGTAILLEEIGKLLQESINEHITKNKLEILGHPLPKQDQNIDFDINALSDYTFSYELGIAPEIDLSFINDKMKFTKEIIRVEDKMLDEEVEHLRKQFGVMSSEDTIVAGDTLKLRIQDIEGVEGGLDTSSTVSESDLNTTANGKKIRALTVGESVDVDIIKAFDKDPKDVVRFILSLSDEEADNGAKKYKVTLEEVNHVELAKLNEEFFTKLQKGENVNCEESLRVAITKDLENYFAQQGDNKMSNDIIDKIIDDCPAQLPEVFLKRWIKFSNEKPITADEVEQGFALFAKNLKRKLIINKVAKQEGYEIDEAEVLEETKAGLRRHTAKYEMNYPVENIVEKFAKRQMSDASYVSETSEFIMERKVLDFIKGRVTIKEKKVSLEEFNEKK